MAAMMRCTTAHWQGNDFVPAGTIRPEGHHQIIDVFFEPFDVDPPDPKKPAKKKDNA